MYLTLTYRPQDGITLKGPAIDATDDLRALGMAWSSRQGKWYVPGSYRRADLLVPLAHQLEEHGHHVTIDATEPATVQDPRRTPAARAHRTQRAAERAPRTGPLAAVQAEIRGLTAALADLDPDNPAVPLLEARLDRAHGRARAWAQHHGHPAPIAG